MIKMENELKVYIEKNLAENFEHIASANNSEHNKLLIYKHKSTNKMLVERISVNRNDDVFRTLKNKKIPNIGKIYEVCSDDDNLIILEEFIDGKNLLEIINGSVLSVKQASKYAFDICRAVNELHKLGIIHRDIKPANIIIDNNDNAVLIDLGIARLISANDEQDTQSLGTIGYAAPEQFGLSQSGKASDIYSLGVLLNMMITGVHPALKTPKSPISHIIKKATSTQISKRYKSAEQLQKELKFFL